MAISLLSIPTRTAASSTGYAGDLNLVITKINELATAMSVSPLTIAAAIGAGNPAADMNQLVAKVNELVGVANSVPSPVNTPPNVSISASGTATAPKLTALAADLDGVQSIFIKVFDANNALVQTFGPSAPGDTTYVTTWSGASVGSYSARCVATDTKGLSATSSPVPFAVTAAGTGTGTQLLFAGDSQVQQFNSDPTITSDLQDLLTSSNPGQFGDFFNGGHSGYSWAQIATLGASEIDSRIDTTHTTYAKTIVLGLAGINSFWHEHKTAQTVYNEAIAYHQARKAAGALNIGNCLTFVPDDAGAGAYDGWTSAQVNAEVAAYNTLMRTNWYGLFPAGALLDYPNIPELATPSSAYSNPDSLHYNAAGRAVIANVLKPVVIRLATGGTYNTPIPYVAPGGYSDPGPVGSIRHWSAETATVANQKVTTWPNYSSASAVADNLVAVGSAADYFSSGGPNNKPYLRLHSKFKGSALLGIASNGSYSDAESILLVCRYPTNPSLLNLCGHGQTVVGSQTDPANDTKFWSLLFYGNTLNFFTGTAVGTSNLGNVDLTNWFIAGVRTNGAGGGNFYGPAGEGADQGVNSSNLANSVLHVGGAPIENFDAPEGLEIAAVLMPQKGNRAKWNDAIAFLKAKYAL